MSNDTDDDPWTGDTNPLGCCQNHRPGGANARQQHGGPGCAWPVPARMTTDTLTITDFILARVAEDEAVAEDLARLGGSWRVDTCGIFDGKDAVLWDEYCLRSALPHIARHDPARVLAQCKATRAIVEFASDATGLDMSVENDRGVGRRDEATDPYLGDEILSALAAVYAGHEDYRDEWSL